MSSYSYTSSSASITSSASRSQPRDYSAAFGMLASSYGSSAAAPCRMASSTASHLVTPTVSSSKSSRKSASTSSRSPMGSYSEKEAASRTQEMGALMDKYGASMSMASGRTGL